MPVTALGINTVHIASGELRFLLGYFWTVLYRVGILYQFIKCSSTVIWQGKSAKVFVVSLCCSCLCILLCKVVDN